MHTISRFFKCTYSVGAPCRIPPFNTSKSVNDFHKIEAYRVKANENLGKYLIHGSVTDQEKSSNISSKTVLPKLGNCYEFS